MRETVCLDEDWIAAAKAPIIPSPGASVDARAVMMPTAAQLPAGAVLGAAIAARGTRARRKREYMFAARSDIGVGAIDSNGETVDLR